MIVKSKDLIKACKMVSGIGVDKNTTVEFISKEGSRYTNELLITIRSKGVSATYKTTIEGTSETLEFNKTHSIYVDAKKFIGLAKRIKDNKQGKIYSVAFELVEADDKEVLTVSYSRHTDEIDSETMDFVLVESGKECLAVKEIKEIDESYLNTLLKRENGRYEIWEKQELLDTISLGLTNTDSYDTFISGKNAKAFSVRGTSLIVSELSKYKEHNQIIPAKTVSSLVGLLEEIDYTELTLTNINNKLIIMDNLEEILITFETSTKAGGKVEVYNNYTNLKYDSLQLSFNTVELMDLLTRKMIETLSRDADASLVYENSEFELRIANEVVPVISVIVSDEMWENVLKDKGLNIKISLADLINALHDMKTEHSAIDFNICLDSINNNQVEEFTSRVGEINADLYKESYEAEMGNMGMYADQQDIKSKRHMEIREAYLGIKVYNLG